MLATATAMGLIVAACSDPPSSDAERPTRDEGSGLPECDVEGFEEAAAEGPIEIELWYGGLVGRADDTMKQLAEDFNASQDQVVLQAEAQSEGYREAWRKFEEASANDQLPELVYLEAEDFGGVLGSGRVLPAQACMEAAGYDMANIEPLARNYFSFDDVLYAGYMNTSTPVLYYNRNHWRHAGLDPEEPPETLEELHQQASEIKAAFAGDDKAESPLALMIDKWWFISLFTGAGIDIVDNGNGRQADPTEAVFNTPEAREILADLKQMADDGVLIPFPRDEGAGEVKAYEAALNQQSSMLFGTSAASATISAFLAGEDISGSEGVDTGEVDLEAIDPRSAPLPGASEPGQIAPGGGGFYIMNSSNPVEQVAGWKFLEFMLQPENARAWTTSTGYVPSVKAVADELEAEGFFEDDPIGILVAPAVESMGDVDADRPGPFMGPYVELTSELEKALQAIFLQDADIEEALATAEANVTEAIQSYYSE